MELALDSMIRD